MTDTLHQVVWTTAAAAALGILMLRIKQPVVLGFLLAGLLLGPTGLALVTDGPAVLALASVAALLLLFVTGLQISVRAVRWERSRAAIAAASQAAAALLVTLIIGTFFGWPLRQSLVVGFALSLSSAAIALRLLESVGEARREPGRMAVGALVAQGVLAVPMLMIAASLAPDAQGGAASGLWLVIRILIAIALVVGALAIASRRAHLRVPLPAALSNPDAGPLTALAVCLLGATLAGLLGLSPIYGALPAALLVGATTLRASMLRVSIPLQSLLLMLFFLAIGLLLDLRSLLPLLPAALFVAVLVVGARIAAGAVAMRLMHAPPRDALIAAASLAPSGELAFAVAAAGFASGALAADGFQLALAAIALSMAATPLWVTAARRAVAHRDTSATTVAGFFVEIFPDELRTARRSAGRAAAAIDAGVRRAAPAVAGALRSFKDLVSRPPRPANDLDVAPPVADAPAKDGPSGEGSGERSSQG